MWDALHAAERLAGFRHGKSVTDYRSGDLLKSAVERQFEMVGEALNQLSKADSALAAEVPDSPRIVAFRDIVIHGYAMVDDAIGWQVLTERLPELERTLSELLAGLNTQA